MNAQERFEHWYAGHKRAVTFVGSRMPLEGSQKEVTEIAFQAGATRQISHVVEQLKEQQRVYEQGSTGWNAVGRCIEIVLSEEE